ncbi:MAG: HAD hydrolase-like protein, partial [Clostridia bacterium]|nr:HAD hydrolase-like protein [Clostridia bacterium]
RILDKHGLDPHESIMIGNDYRTDIQGSYNAGMDSLYLHTNISPEIKGECPAKYKIMSGSLIEARKALFSEKNKNRCGEHSFLSTTVLSMIKAIIHQA